MRKRKKSPKKPLRLLDKVPTKSRRGRPGVRASEVVGRAENYGRMFWNHRLDTRKNQWVRDKPYEWAVALVKAKTADDVSHALDSASHDAQTEFKPLISLILRVCKEPAFPKTHEAQFDFLAESLAAYGRVSPRRSRDICAAERATQRAKSPHKIVRKEFYVECSCGYKGPARNNACRECGAGIPLSMDDLFGPSLS
jgi:hypothetical protein